MKVERFNKIFDYNKAIKFGNILKNNLFENNLNYNNKVFDFDNKNTE
jgi:hypothetical protein